MARPFLIFILISMVTLLGGCASHRQGPYQLSLEQSEAAMASYRRADYKEAVRQYEFLTSQVPKDANFWFYLGNAYAKDKQPQRAVMAYENALIRDNGLGKAWYNMGLLQMQQALKTFIDMQENLPENDPARKLGREKMDALFQLLGQTK